jgi:S-ribosylhomocysteine lyase
MEKIASFRVNHDVLTPGIYLSRIDRGTLETYDLRLKTPNQGDYLDPAAAHTIEHLAATYFRSGKLSDRVVYFGPMGCLTGFYLILDGVPRADAIREIQDCFAFIKTFDGEIPGSARAECGNYRFHNLPSAREEAAAYADTIADWTPARMVYPE